MRDARGHLFLVIDSEAEDWPYFQKFKTQLVQRFNGMRRQSRCKSQGFSYKGHHYVYRGIITISWVKGFLGPLEKSQTQERSGNGR